MNQPITQSTEIMAKSNIIEKRLSAIYDFRNCSNNHQRNELLNLLLAIMNDNQIKTIVEELNLKIK